MATLHIRDLKDSVKESLRVRAAQNGRSMEAEARVVLEEAAERATTEPVKSRVRRLVEKYELTDFGIQEREGLTGAQFVALMRTAVETYGPLDIEIPARGPSHRKIPDFSK